MIPLVTEGLTISEPRFESWISVPPGQRFGCWCQTWERWPQNWMLRVVDVRTRRLVFFRDGYESKSAAVAAGDAKVAIFCAG